MGVLRLRSESRPTSNAVRLVISLLLAAREYANWMQMFPLVHIFVWQSL